MNNTPVAPQIQFSYDTSTRRLVGHAILSRFMGDPGELGQPFRAALEASKITSQLQDLCIAVLSFRDYLDDVRGGGYNKILHKTMEVLVPAYAEIELGRLIWGPGRFFDFNSPIDPDYATKYCNIAALTMSRFRRVGNWSNASTLTFADYPLNEAIFYFFDCLYEHLFWSQHENILISGQCIDYKMHKYLELKLHPNMINSMMRPVFQVHIDRAKYYVKNSSLPLHFKTPIQTMLQYAIHLDLRLLPTMLSIGYSKAHTIPVKASTSISKAQRKKRSNACQQKLIDDLTKLILSFLHPSIYNNAFDATRDVSSLSVLLCACDDKKRKYFAPGKITFYFSSIHKALFENRDNFTIKLKYGVEHLIHKHETKHIPRAIDYLHSIGHHPLVEVDLEILKLSPTILRRYGQFMSKFKVMLLTTSSETRWSFQENADMFTFSEWSDEDSTAASYVVHHEPWLRDHILQLEEKIDNLFFLGGSLITNLKISGGLCYAFYGQTPSRFTQNQQGFLPFLRARRSAKYIYRCVMSYFGNLDSMEIDLFGTGRRYHEKAVYLSEILLTATPADQRNLESLRHKLKKLWVMKNKTRITEGNVSFFKATCEYADVSANDCQDASKIDVSAPINLMVTLK